MKTINSSSNKFGSRLSRWLVASAMMIGVGVGLSDSAFAGISNTKHNLSTTQTTGNRVTSGTGANQICVFCHTPHGADVSSTNAPPLWNKKLPTGNTYQTYAALNTATLDGEVLTPNGGVSMACLSCHDGTQAMDTMINAPGSGGYNASGERPSGWVWAGSNVDTSTGQLKSGIITNLTTDLRNDHPIGIQYCGGGISGSGTTISGSCRDPDFKSDAADLKAATINGNQMFWVETNSTSGRQKEDIVLYTRTFTAGSGPSVECGSCHDPHVESKGSDNIAFMRVTTNASAICLACHVK